jgi:hypothetical protein
VSDDSAATILKSHWRDHTYLTFFCCCCELLRNILFGVYGVVENPEEEIKREQNTVK